MFSSASLQTRFPRLLVNHDAYERHYWTARLLGRVSAGESLIDVGGERGLQRFLPALRVLNVNVSGPDQADFAQLADRSFDYAVSIDTIEHIPVAERRGHLELLLRLARRRVVFCAPLGSSAQDDFQRRLLDAGTLDPGSLEYLRQHLEYGLPTPEQLERLLPGTRIQWFYSGDIRMYVVPAPLPRSRLLRALWLGVGLGLNWLMNSVWLYFKVGRRPHPFTNRFYGIIDLEN